MTGSLLWKMPLMLPSVTTFREHGILPRVDKEQFNTVPKFTSGSHLPTRSKLLLVLSSNCWSRKSTRYYESFTKTGKR